MLTVVFLTDSTGILLPFLGAAAIHECSHLFMMCILKSKPKSVRLIPGGINIEENGSNDLYEQLLILIAGPLANLLIFFIANNEFSMLNLLLFIYNMLPVKGLDGGRIVYIVCCTCLPSEKAEKIVSFLTVLIAIFFFGFFLVLYFSGIKNYSVLIFSLYIISGIFLKKGVERKH